VQGFAKSSGVIKGLTPDTYAVRVGPGGTAVGKGGGCCLEPRNRVRGEGWMHKLYRYNDYESAHTHTWPMVPTSWSSILKGRPKAAATSFESHFSNAHLGVWCAHLHTFRTAMLYKTIAKGCVFVLAHDTACPAGCMARSGHEGWAARTRPCRMLLASASCWPSAIRSGTGRMQSLLNHKHGRARAGGTSTG
jgi:hypothetical protein